MKHLTVLLAAKKFSGHIAVGDEMGLSDEAEQLYGCTVNVKRLSKRKYDMPFHVKDKNKVCNECA